MSKLLLLVAVGCLALAPAINAQDAAVTPKKKPTAQSAMKAAQDAAVAPKQKPTAQSAMKAAQQALAKTPAKAARPAVRADRLDLETTVVTGNRELPKVLYIVPWKKADLGEMPAQPFNTLLDEVLEPVDREVFKREVKYFQAVAGGVGSGAAAHQSGSAPPASAAQ
jgi:hypothetical protein